MSENSPDKEQQWREQRSAFRPFLRDMLGLSKEQITKIFEQIEEEGEDKRSETLKELSNYLGHHLDKVKAIKLTAKESEKYCDDIRERKKSYEEAIAKTDTKGELTGDDLKEFLVAEEENLRETLQEFAKDKLNGRPANLLAEAVFENQIWPKMLEVLAKNKMAASAPPEPKKQTPQKDDGGPDTLHSQAEILDYLQQQLGFSKHIRHELQVNLKNAPVEDNSFPIVQKAAIQPLIDGLKSVAKETGATMNELIGHNLIQITEHITFVLNGGFISFETNESVKSKKPSQDASKPLFDNADAPPPIIVPKNKHREKEIQDILEQEDKNTKHAAIALGGAAVAGYFTTKAIHDHNRKKELEQKTGQKQPGTEFSKVSAVTWGALAVGALALAVDQFTGGKYTRMVTSVFTGGRSR